MSAAPATKPTREPPAAWQVPSGGSSGSASGSGAPAASTAAWGAAVVHASPAAGPAVNAAALPPPPGQHSGGSAAGQVQAQVQAQAQGRLSLGDTLEDSANVALTSVLHAAPCAPRHMQQQHYLGHASLPWASNDRLVSVACKVSPSGLPAASPWASVWLAALPFHVIVLLHSRWQHFDTLSLPCSRLLAAVQRHSRRAAPGPAVTAAGERCVAPAPAFRHCSVGQHGVPLLVGRCKVHFK